MGKYIESLDENTNEFLNDVCYPNVHMMWSEWLEKAKAYGFDDTEIAELNQYLEENKQLTVPVRFGGGQWWLTKQEIRHVELLKQYFPSDWETKTYKRMNDRSLGKINKDWDLKGRRKVQQ